jgi:hypothetical protein
VKGSFFTSGVITGRGSMGAERSVGLGRVDRVPPGGGVSIPNNRETPPKLVTAAAATCRKKRRESIVPSQNALHRTRLLDERCIRSACQKAIFIGLLCLLGFELLTRHGYFGFKSKEVRARVMPGNIEGHHFSVNLI